MLPINENMVLSLSSSYRDAKRLIEANPDYHVIPIVDSFSSMVVVGSALTREIKLVLKKIDELDAAIGDGPGSEMVIVCSRI